MDEIVRQAIAKWPNVPHCFAWLALDARGNWRMRDDQAQAAELPGDPIRNAALLGFINRNYLRDDDGQWYFQNGPQRVYVDLEVCPFVCRTDPVHGLVLHTGQPFGDPQSVLLTDEGDLVFARDGRCASLDDRDLAAMLPRLRLDGQPLDEASLAGWLAGTEKRALTFDWGPVRLPVQSGTRAGLPSQFGFVRRPGKPD